MNQDRLMIGLKESFKHFLLVLSKRKRKDYSFTKKDEEILQTFLVILEGTQKLTLGARYWFEYLCFCFNYQLYKKKDISKIYFVDIFNKEALKYWNERDVEQSHFFIQRFIKENDKLSIEEISIYFEEDEDKEYLSNASEEYFKEKYFNTDNGFDLCISNTNFYFYLQLLLIQNNCHTVPFSKLFFLSS